MENLLNQSTGLAGFGEDQDYFHTDYSLPSLSGESLGLQMKTAPSFEVFQGGPAQCPQELQLMTLINVPAEEPQTQTVHLDLQDRIISPEASLGRQPGSYRGPVRPTSRAAKKTGPEVLQKKALRLISHRKANQEYRQRNKEYLKRLELHVAELEKKNKSLMEQIQDVKKVFEHDIQ